MSNFLTRHRMGLQLLSSALAVLLLYLLLRKMPLASLLGALRSADWKRVALAAALNLVINTFGRAKRFSTLLDPLPRSGPRASLGELAALILASRALNMVLPARAGETLRAVKLQRRNGYGMESVIAAILLEPILDVLALGGWALILLLDIAFGAVGLPGSAKRILIKLVLAAILLVSLGLLATVTGRIRPRKVPSKTPPVGAAARFRHSLRLLNTPWLWGRALAWTWVADAIDLATIGLCLAAVGIHLGLIDWFIILGGVNLAIALPAAPGNLGTLEAGAVLTVGLLGFGGSQALAFALLYHSVHVIPIAAAGFAAFQLEAVRS